MANEIIKVQETEKEWTLVGEVASWEDLFLNKENFEPILEFARERSEKLVADPTTKDGQIARKTLAKRIGQVQKAIEEKGNEVAKILKEKPNKIDYTRRMVKQTLLKYKEDVLAPLKEIEARQDLIAEIANLPATGIGCDSYALRDLIARLDDYEAKDWKESATMAFEAIKIARAQLNSMLTSVEKSEADARELEELRKHKAEIDAAQKAKAEEELKKAQAEAAKAKKEKEDAEKRAEAAEKAQAIAESKVPDWKKNEVNESDRLFPEDVTEKKRRYNREALDKMTELTMGDLTMAKDIITAIAKCQIPHIYIDYELAAIY